MSLSRDPITGAFITKPSVQIAPSANAAAANSAAARVVTTVPSLKLATGVNIDSSLSIKLSALDVTPSTTPQPGKAVVATATGSVVGINRLTCSSLKINGVVLDTSIFASSSGSSDDINNPLLQVTPGVASASKALTLNNQMSLSGLKRIKVDQVSNGSRRLIQPSGILIPRLIDSKVCHPKDVTMLNALNSATNSTTWFNDRNTVTSGSNSKYSAFSKKLNRYVSNYDAVLLTSVDGHHWVPVFTASSALNTLRYFSIPSQIDIFVGTTNSQLVYSTDGLTWTSLSIPHAGTAANAMNDITYSSALGKFLIVGSHTSYLFSSADMFTPDLWTIGEYYNVGLRTVVYAAFCDYFFAITTNNDVHTLRSRNGITWTTCPDQAGVRNVASNFCSIAVSEELGIVVAGYNSAINTYNHMRYTRNGVDWFACATSTYGKIVTIQWTPQLFMFTALMLGGNYSYSLNGIEWFTQYNGTVSTTGGMINYCESLDCLTIRLDAAYSKTYSIGGRSTASNKLDLDQENARVGLGIAAHAQSALSLGGNGSKMIKMRESTDVAMPEVYLENNQLSFKAPAMVINPNKSSGYAIKLNGVAIDPSFWSTSQDKLIGLSSANTSANKLALTNTDQSLQGVVSVDSLTVNGQPVDTTALAAQSDSRLPSALGVAETGKVLTHKSGKVVLSKANIASLNTAYSKIRNLSSYYATSVNTPPPITINNISQPYLASLDMSRTFDAVANSITYTTITGGLFTDLYCYVEHLGLFITVRTNNTGYTLIRPRSAGVTFTFPYNLGTIASVIYSPEFKRVYVSGSNYKIHSTNLVTWERVQMSSTATFNSIAYSPELCLAIVGTSSGLWWTRDGVTFGNTNNIIGSANCTPFWSSEWGMFVVANTGSTYSRPVVSSDGFNWRHLDISQKSLDYSTTSITRFAYSPKLQLLVAISSSLVYVSNDAANFKAVASISNIVDVKWIPELEVFIAGSSSIQLYHFSKDGYNWTSVANPSGTVYGNTCGIFYNKALGGLMWPNATTGGSATMSTCVKNFEGYDTSAVLCETENIVVDNVNNRVGIGKTPDYTLELSMDLAFKPATNTWATSSDARLKEDIQPADILICRQVVDTIPLKHYKWNLPSQGLTPGSVLDDSQLGWIAQDVEKVLPKCVTSKDRLGLSDCRDLNSDQLIAHMWGALQSIICDVEELQAAA